MFLKRLFAFIPKDEFSRALSLFNSGEHRKALAKFEELRVLAEEAGDVDRSTLDLYTCEAHVAISKEYLEANNLESATTAMEAAVRIKPQFADLHYKLGVLYSRLDRNDDAAASFRRSLEINNKFFRARIYLSLVLRDAGQADAAVEEVLASRQSCPNFYRESLDALVIALRTASEADVTRLYSELIDERPSSAQISRELAVEAIQNGNTNEAIRELKKAIALKPDYPDLHNYLGIAYGNNGMVDDAVYEFEIALKINPYYSKARLNLALLYYENNRYDEAQAQIDQVLSVQPDNQLANNLQHELKVIAGARPGK
ncbi:MAG TPA: tetratricopeptide repeat protein [Candidatus Krumholzibacteria bacterium]|nr:tetratricopeptide repeat protein [Candidatus Krumholzibacteria bacterium]